MALERAVVFLVVAASVLAAAQGGVWTVGGNSSVSLTDALAALTSNSVIYLERGEHRIERFHLLQDLTNVSIIGRGPDTYDYNVTVTCADDVGLAFVNVTRLTLENLRVSRCGLSGGNLQQTVDRLQDIVVLFHNIPDDIYIGLLLGHCTDVVVMNVAVLKTAGIGLLGVNVMGNSRMSYVNFTGNVRRLENCSFVLQQTYGKDSRQIGGGAFLTYYDYQPASEIEYDENIVTLDIGPAYFLHNSDCTYEMFHAMNARESNLLRDQVYGLGGGGGLSLIMTQQQYGVEARVESTVFLNNTARFGGGALVGVYSGVLNAKVTFRDCHVYKNGFASEDPLTHITYAGAGITIANDIFRPDLVDVVKLKSQ